MFTAISAWLADKLGILKLILCLIIVGAIFYAGYDIGGNASTAASAKEKAELNRQISDLQDALTKEKVLVADTVANINAAAARRIAAAEDRNNAIEEAARQKVTKIQLEYQKQGKELEDAKTKLIEAAVTDPTNPNTTGGLWVYIEEATCHRQNGGGPSGSAVSKSPGLDAGSWITQCRLSPKTSVPLIQLASEADEIAIQLNLCYKEASVVQDMTKPRSNVGDLPTTLPNQISTPTPPIN